jgi:methylmalonyl-CoA mutase cobalamin-binding domain/chain
MMNVIDKLADAVLDADVAKAENLVKQWVTDHGYDKLLEDLLMPVLNKISNMFDENAVSLAQSYVVSLLAEKVLDIIQSHKKDTPDQKCYGPIVIGNIEDDCHPLGRKIVASVARAYGWEVFDLGIDVEAKEFVDKAVEVGAKVIVVSAMTFTTARNIISVREEIDRRGLKDKIKLAVGGASFNRQIELVDEVKADGYSSDALKAPPLFKRLWDEVEQTEGEQS